MNIQTLRRRICRAACAAISLLLIPCCSIAADEAERPVITLPIRVHLLQSEKESEFNTTLEKKDIERIFGKVNKVWSPAGVQFEVESIAATQALDVDPPEKYA